MPHPVAISGFSSDPRRYEQGRPGYPPDAVGFVLENIPSDPDDLILDIGAGTGKLTRALVSTPATVVAIDPVPEMIRLLPEFAPSAHVVLGVAEHLPVAPGAVSAITVAQALHWFDGDRARAEFARALRPDGAVALIGNARLREVEWVDRIWRLMDRIEESAPWRNPDRPDGSATHAALS
jgi:SAM-dependent methyltransferase